MEIGYVVHTSTNFAQYDFFQIPKFVLSEDPLYFKLEKVKNQIQIDRGNTMYETRVKLKSKQTFAFFYAHYLLIQKAKL